MVRLPDGMRDHLSHAAKVNKRSVNAEVVAALEAWLYPGEYEDPFKDPEKRENIEKLFQRFIDYAARRSPGLRKDWGLEHIKPFEENDSENLK